MTSLPPHAFARADASSDHEFYAQPRFVAHIDDRAIAAVTQLYRELVPANASVLDLMSSWISHLPPEISYPRVVGLGMNRQELEGNPQLHERVVQSLNDEPRLPFEDSSFGAVLCCVSVQYLTRPVEVLREVARVSEPGALLIITFSNRCFPTKAVAVWQALDDAGHGALVSKYLQEAGGWSGIEFLDRSPMPRRGDPLFAVTARRV